jgi:hypothetical protein
VLSVDSAAKNAIAPERQAQYQVQIERLQKRLKGVASQSRRTNLVRALPPSQRQVLVEVFAAIYQGEANLQQAQALVETIAKEIARSAAGQGWKRSRYCPKG